MAYREINRSTPNDGLGDDARTWSGKTNENFKELFSRSFLIGTWEVSRSVYDATNLSFDAFKLDDLVKGWEDATTKTRWVEGVVLDATISLPADIDNAAKFFIINDKTKL